MLYIITIFLVEIILFFANYITGTYLIGWDNVMPEFNLWLNFKRALLAVWQDYRGLGLLDGMAHSANLFHTIYIALLSLIFPQSMVRYVFIFITHLAGGIGFFYLAKHLTKNKKASFLGALFYMFNLGVIQMYFAPLEVFAVHFAALPLLALFTIKALKNPTRKNLLFFFLVSVLTTPQAFVPTVFFASVVLLVFLIAVYRVRNVVSSILLTFLFFAANAFWAIPYLYSAKDNANIIPKTRINQFSSEEIFYRNRAFGDLSDVLRLKGFMMETTEYDNKTNTNILMMDEWKKHQETTGYQLIFITILAISFLGLVKTIKDKQRAFFPYLASLGISFFFLANNTSPFAQLNNWTRNVFPVVGEALRFPFTKFETLFAFCLSIFFTLGLISLLNRFKKLEKLIIIVLLSSIFFLSFPAFQGYFISPLLKQELPKDYLMLMAYLDKVDQNQRIAVLPANTFWNWEYRSWGHRGSGFLWYGIKQPILVRAFDPWSRYNEQFYNELSYAVSSENRELFQNVLRKYNISYLLVDQYLINSLSSKPINFEKLNRFLKDVETIKKEKEFGKLILYQFKESFPRISTLDTKNTISPPFSYTRKDDRFSDLGDYVNPAFGGVNEKTNPAFIYPFSSFFTEKTQDDLEFTAANKMQNIIISPKQINPFSLKEHELYLPSLFENEHLIPVKFEAEDGKVILKPVYPTLYLNGQEVQIEEKPIILTPRLVKEPKEITLTDINHTILPGQSAYIQNHFLNTLKLTDGVSEELLLVDTFSIDRKGLIVKLNRETVERIAVAIKKIRSPFTFPTLIKRIKDSSVWLPNLPHQASYIIFAYNAKYYTKYNHYASGLPIYFSVDNISERRTELETILSKQKQENVIVLPKTQDVFEGYGMRFLAKSAGDTTTQGEIKEMSLYPFPMTTLTRILFVRSDGKTPTNSYLILNQSFHPGWKAFQIKNSKGGPIKIKNFFNTYLPFIFGKELKDHVLINNWANGWKTNSNQLQTNSTIITIFFPQYLEFLGFILGVVVLLVLSLFGGSDVQPDYNRQKTSRNW